MSAALKFALCLYSCPTKKKHSKGHKMKDNQMRNVPGCVWVRGVGPLVIQNGISLGVVIIIVVVQQDKSLVLLKVSLRMKRIFF